MFTLRSGSSFKRTVCDADQNNAARYITDPVELRAALDRRPDECGQPGSDYLPDLTAFSTVQKLRLPPQGTGLSTNTAA